MVFIIDKRRGAVFTSTSDISSQSTQYINFSPSPWNCPSSSPPSSTASPIVPQPQRHGQLTVSDDTRPVNSVIITHTNIYIVSQKCKSSHYMEGWPRGSASRQFRQSSSWPLESASGAPQALWGSPLAAPALMRRGSLCSSVLFNPMPRSATFV